MTQQVSSPPEQPGEHPPISQPLPRQTPRFSRVGIVSLLVLIGLQVLLCTGLLIGNLPQAIALSTPHLAQTMQASGQNDTGPLSIPGDATVPTLQISGEHYMVYEQQNTVDLISVAGGGPTVVATPGYVYNRAIPPILTPSGQLLYSGDGLWLTDLFGGTPEQVATLPAGQVITSMALSSDGTTVAWSTEPIDGDGMSSLYAGPLDASLLVYQHSASDCPCYRVFSFLNGAGTQGNTTLLLTDDRGDHHAVQYGLWSFDLTGTQPGNLQQILDEDPQQGPLMLAPSGSTLLYSRNEGVVPAPSDSSVPDDVAALNYANSLLVTTITKNPTMPLSTSHVVLAEQHDLNNSGTYHWVTTPLFSPDGHTLVYIVFSSDAQVPFARHSAVYTVQVSGSGAKLHTSKPQLLATSSSLFMELGVWLNDHVVTFYADDAMYVLDINSGAVTQVAMMGAYARAVAIVQRSAVENTPEASATSHR